MIAYDVSYGRRAFRTKIDSEGIPVDILELLLERVIKSVQEQSDGRWIISNKAVVTSSDRTKPVELTVVVPAGSDQYEQYLAAVRLFEDRVAIWLTDYPFDTSLRTIESGEAKCVVCGEKADWVRSIRVPGLSGDTPFCTIHAQKQQDFRYCGPSTFYWQQLEPATT